jgi:hypothetical protein
MKTTKNYFKEIDLERLSITLHRRIAERVPNASLGDVKEILYIHFALVKSVITSDNFKVVRFKYFGTFNVHYNIFFRFMGTIYKKVSEGRKPLREYLEIYNKYMPWFEDLKQHKTSKHYDITKEDWEEYYGTKKES